jgi:hypothetical protein
MMFYIIIKRNLYSPPVHRRGKSGLYAITARGIKKPPPGGGGPMTAKEQMSF